MKVVRSRTKLEGDYEEVIYGVGLGVLCEVNRRYAHTLSQGLVLPRGVSWRTYNMLNFTIDTYLYSAEHLLRGRLD